MVALTHAFGAKPPVVSLQNGPQQTLEARINPKFADATRMNPADVQSIFNGIVGGVSPMGSADPNYQNFAKTGAQNTMWVAPGVELGKPTTGWASNLRMNPMLEDFSKQFKNPKFQSFLKTNPHIQAKLFDGDNRVKSNAGIFRQKQDGLQQFGIDGDGGQLFAAPEMMNKDGEHWNAGHDQVHMIGHVMDSVGAFQDEDEAGRFAHAAKISSDPKFMGFLTTKIGAGDKKGAVNEILRQFGVKNLDNIKDPTHLPVAFAAHNTVANWDKLNPTQRSMAFSGMALQAYRYKDGQPIGKRQLIGNEDPDGPTLDVDTAMGLASTGVNVPQLMKNWDQVDAIQRLTFGKGTASQMATTARRYGLLGAPQNKDSAVAGVSADKLAKLGFMSTPGAGVGAIAGPEDSLPEGYTVIGAGAKAGKVIAVPTHLAATAATTQGTARVTSLGSSPDVPMASHETYKVYSKWAKAPPKQNGLVGGTAMAAGLHQSGLVDDPYTRGAIAAVSVHGNTTPYRVRMQQQMMPSKQEQNEALVKGLRQTGEDIALNIATGGVSGKVQTIDRKFLGGQTDKLRNKAEDLNPLQQQTDKLTAKVLGKGMDAFEANFGGKPEEQQARDHIRSRAQDLGIVSQDWKVTLADGSMADVGTDGSGGKHEFRFADKVPEGNPVRSLNAYDVDYTNDLDFSANMMTSALARLFSGGKGTAIDQFAGQLANSSLGGFGQDMTEETFGKVQANIRGFFAQSGIKSKEDAYALLNEGFSQSRFAEMDLIAIQQGINMAFDEDGFDTAMQLMAGRWNGLDVAHDMPNSPGPNFVWPGDPGYRPPAGGIDPGNRPNPTGTPTVPRFPGSGNPSDPLGPPPFVPYPDSKLTPGLDKTDPGWYLPGYVPPLEMQRNPGYYDGSRTAGTYDKSYNNYNQNWMTQDWSKTAEEMKEKKDK